MNSITTPSDSFTAGLKGLVTLGVVSKASGALGESEATVRKGLGAAVSTIFGTLVSRADDRSFMSHMFEMVKDPAAESIVLGTSAALGGIGASSAAGIGGLGNRFLSALFGNKMESVGKALSGFAGVKQSTAGSMLSLAGPLALSYLGRTVRKDGLDISGLSKMLLSQKNAIMRLVPSSLSGVPGFSAQITDYRTVDTAVRKVSPARWLVPLTLILLAVLGLLWLFGGRSPAGYITKSLAGGLKLQYARGGVEDKLLSFIEDSSQRADREMWFDFDRFLFETNSAVLKPESSAQLANIAAILKTYPAVHVKIGGYTDSSGDAAANLALSQNRAHSVMQELKRLGISPDRLSSEGYGGEHPVADNATEAGRTQNRRVAIRVTEK